MGSYNYGKTEIVEWVKKTFPKGSTCLDVGACDGKWWYLLGDYLKMDCVEIFKPNVYVHELMMKYERTFIKDIADFHYGYGRYDLIIFGDVLEHMTVEKAQNVLEYAKPRCKDMIIAIPYLYTQPPIYGNPWEEHIQNDLTDEIFNQRYKGFTPLWKNSEYGYYHKDYQQERCEPV